ncbi:MAG: MBL fold metallo-hydrolase [Streptosporangiales bacterium]|nr:MBL fold metallo-hydrolase [Streptosporangiales bacterium]
MRQRERIDDDERHRWEEPGVYDVMPGLYRVPLPLPQDGLRAVNVYVLEGDDGLTLVDAGWALDVSRAQLGDALAELSYSVADVRSILVTHVHRDHYTQGVALRRESGCVLRLGEGERPSLENLNNGLHLNGEGHLARLSRHGGEDLVAELRSASSGPSTDPTLWELPDEWVTSGREFRVGGLGLRALHTPGHTQGHLTYVVPSHETVFTGDHVLPHITPSIGFENQGGALPLRDYLESLALMRGLPDSMMLPAHGPVRSSVHARVGELLAHHEERLDACVALLDGKPCTAFQVAQELGWTRRNRRFDDLDAGNRMLAVCETAAHLDVLELRGRCVRTDDDGTIRYHLDDP